MKKDKTKQEEKVPVPCAETELPPAADAPAEAAEPETEAQAQMDYVQVERKQLEEASRLFDEAQKQRDEYLKMAQRVQAEFDNYRKRNATLRTDAEDEAVQKCVLALLPTVDNLERALSAEKEDTPLKAGVSMTLRGLMDALVKLGLETVPCEKGQSFDPEIHNAVMTGEADDDTPAGSVAEVFQTGYRVRGKVIRYAMVKVAQ